MRYFALLVLFFAHSALANIQITKVSGASASQLITSGTGTPSIIGGISGPTAGCTTNSDSFCNSCDAPDVSCNRRRIHDNLEVEIYFKVTSEIEGEFILGYNDGSNDTALNKGSDYTVSTSTNSLSKDDTGVVRITWEVLCDLMEEVEGLTAGQGCLAIAEGGEGGGEFTLILALDDIDDDAKRSEAKVEIFEPDFDGGQPLSPGLYVDGAASPDVGLDGFAVVPGDEKIYIDEIDPSSTCPDTNTSTVKKFRFFYSTTDFVTANYNSSNYKDFEVDSECNPKGDWIIDGLENGTYYHVRAAILDEAENAAFLTDASIYTTLAGCVDPVASDGDDAACVYAAKPDDVIGLFNEDLNCFIATATYGSRFHSYVHTLRQFRSRILLPHRWGRDFIRAYYKFGPPAAKWIADKPVAKTIMAAVLTPVTGFAWLSVYYGLSGAILLLISALVGLGIWTRRLRAERMK